jgi:hypothetical protein
MRYMQMEKCIEPFPVLGFAAGDLAQSPERYYELSPLMPVCPVVEAVEAICRCCVGGVFAGDMIGNLLLIE